MSATRTAFSTVAEAAGLLNVPRSFLEQEIDANRIPHLRIGRRILLDLDAVRAALVEQSRCSGHMACGV